MHTWNAMSICFPCTVLVMHQVHHSFFPPVYHVRLAALACAPRTCSGHPARRRSRHAACDLNGFFRLVCQSYQAGHLQPDYIVFSQSCFFCTLTFASFLPQEKMHAAFMYVTVCYCMYVCNSMLQYVCYSMYVTVCYCMYVGNSMLQFVTVCYSMYVYSVQYAAVLLLHCLLHAQV